MISDYEMRNFWNEQPKTKAVQTMDPELKEGKKPENEAETKPVTVESDWQN